MSCVLVGVFVLWGGGSAQASLHGAQLIGRSVRGRPIYAYRLGSGDGKAVLVVGCIDGDEPAGIAIVDTLQRSRPPRGVTLWLISTITRTGWQRQRSATPAVST